MSRPPPGGARGPRRISRADVAARANVSHGTVSHVLNHPERVRPDTRARVEAAIAELGFVRDEAARHLRAGYSTTIGLMLLDAWNPSFTEVARGVEERTALGPWTVLMSNTARDTDREQRYLQEYAARRVAGLIVIPNDHADGQAMLPTNVGVPMVVVDRADQGGDTMSIAVDDVLGGRLVAEHLAGLGHRRIAFVGDPDFARPVRSRFEGFAQALRERGVLDLEVLPAPLTIEGGLVVGRQLATRSAAERPTAVAAAVDLLAFGILQSLLAAGVRVPDEMSLAGYDDIPFTAQLSVPLTSLARPHAQMGVDAADLLLRELEGDRPEERHLLRRPELMVRASTGPPPDASERPPRGPTR
ncbi:LacI family DNA-binding transcriptional regulator [Microlunatus antarcticus]|uniref:LacI family transcriptional regulator n=1 Tax=Microlunatus antarcticus TaxID=53388 RepID=A0A7W5JYT5_9ACTN|nr:LacI family transcriptional regulator [Microlunatus antarcticus]